MHLKRYKRKTVQEALLAVREELGPTAVALSTRVVPASGVRGWMGRRMVAVTAATDGIRCRNTDSRTASRQRRPAQSVRSLPDSKPRASSGRELRYYGFIMNDHS